MAAIAAPVRKVGAQASCDVVELQIPCHERRKSAQIVEEAVEIDVVAMPPREERDEEGLIRDRDARRAIENDAEQGRSRAADAEDEERGRQGSTGSFTTTSALSAKRPRSETMTL